METFISVNDYFKEELKHLNCSEETRAYIISIFSKYRFNNNDLSKQSITVEYSIAKLENNFNRLQNLGDWLFYTNTLYPESLRHASKDYYHSVGQMSYYSCYKIVRDWRLYEQLADRFIELSNSSRTILNSF
jgi:hypothetical protein